MDLIIYFIGAVVSLIVLICFFVLCGNVRSIANNIQWLYNFERARMWKEGLLDKDGKVITPPRPEKPDTTDEPPEDKRKGLIVNSDGSWECPECNRENPPNKRRCQSCGYDKMKTLED
jgi:hypothetical protein